MIEYAIVYEGKILETQDSVEDIIKSLYTYQSHGFKQSFIAEIEKK